MHVQEANQETSPVTDGEPGSQVPGSYHEAVRADKEGAAKTAQQLAAAMPSLADKVQALLLYWEKKYKQLWDQDRDAFFRWCIDSTLSYHGTCAIASDEKQVCQPEPALAQCQLLFSANAVSSPA